MDRLITFALAGLIAQLIDGSLGMGFGVIGTSVLVATGATAATASAVIHAAKIGSSVTSGAAHWRFGNVHWRTVLLIGVPGAIGGYSGATLLSNIDGHQISPVTAGILLVLGGYMVYRFVYVKETAPADPSQMRKRFLVPLGVVGGVVDAIGGGGWGPVTTPTLMAVGRMEPRAAVGSVSFAELLVAIGATIGFLGHLSPEAINWGYVVALLVGAAIVSPFAAWIVKIVPPRTMGTAVGMLIVVLNVRTILSALGANGHMIAAAMISVGLLGLALVTRSVHEWRAGRSSYEVLPSSNADARGGEVDKMLDRSVIS